MNHIFRNLKAGNIQREVYLAMKAYVDRHGSIPDFQTLLSNLSLLSPAKLSTLGRSYRRWKKVVEWEKIKDELQRKKDFLEAEGRFQALKEAEEKREAEFF